MLDKLKQLALRYEDLQAQLADPAVYGNMDKLKSINRDLKELGPVVETYHAYQQALADRRRRKNSSTTRISGNWPRRNWPTPENGWSGWSRN